MHIDWADPLSQPGGRLKGMGDIGMGSWLSDLLKRNKETIGKITGVIGAVTGVNLTPPTTTIVAPPPPPPAPTAAEKALEEAKRMLEEKQKQDQQRLLLFGLLGIGAIVALKK